MRLVNIFLQKIKLLEFVLPRQLFVHRMSSSKVSMFPAKSDLYKGMTVESSDLDLSDKEFEESLEVSLRDWLKSGVRGLWFKINLQSSSYIPILVKHGFTFHHAKASYVVLTRWLPADEPNLLPQYPHTHIGVAGLVINEKRQVLTIQEKFRKPHHIYWKLPGGYSNPGEDFADAARREVFEETGIESKFISVVAFRHHHEHIFSCSDIYVVCQLQPLSYDIQKSKEEIADCQWMDIETYRNHPQVTEFNRHIINTFLECEKLQCSIKLSNVLSYNKKAYHKVYNIQRVKEIAENQNQ